MKEPLVPKQYLVPFETQEADFQEVSLFRISYCRGDRTRTCDSLVPNQERYQLRYTSL